MSIEKVKAYFEAKGMLDRVMEFDVSSATVDLAAEALGVDGSRIAKTLSFLVKEKPVLVVTAGDARIDNAKFKAFFHSCNPVFCLVLRCEPRQYISHTFTAGINLFNRQCRYDFIFHSGEAVIILAVITHK